MAGAERLDAFALMKQFRADEGLLAEALALFVDRPDYGFIWLAYDDGIPAASFRHYRDLEPPLTVSRRRR